PTQRSRGPLWGALPLCKKVDSVRFKQQLAAPEHALGKDRNIQHRRETACVSGYAPHHPGVLVIHLSPDGALTKRLVILRRRNQSFPRVGWVEGDHLQPQGVIDFVFPELIQWTLSQPCQGFA